MSQLWGLNIKKALKSAALHLTCVAKTEEFIEFFLNIENMLFEQIFKIDLNQI